MVLLHITQLCSNHHLGSRWNDHGTPMLHTEWWMSDCCDVR